jgi:hypothetical protein
VGGCYTRTVRRLHQPFAAFWREHFGGEFG